MWVSLSHTGRVVLFSGSGCQPRPHIRIALDDVENPSFHSVGLWLGLGLSLSLSLGLGFSLVILMCSQSWEHCFGEVAKGLGGLGF